MSPASAKTKSKSAVPNPDEAARILRDVVAPNLGASSAFANTTGDNQERMTYVSERLASATAVLEVANPGVPGAAAAELRAAALMLESSPGWKVTRGHNSAAKFATTKLGLARQGIEDAIAQLTAPASTTTGQPKPRPKPKPKAGGTGTDTVTTSIFAAYGWLAVRYEALMDPATLAAAGVKWVAAVVSHGVNADGSHNNDADDRTNQAWLAAGNAKAYREAGIKVGAWGWQEVGPETEATIAATHVESFDLDFWVANGEAVWKPDDGRFVANGPERFAAALERELAARGKGGLQVGWSVLGAPPAPFAYGYDYQAFTKRGWHILPQAYPQQASEYALANVIDHALARASIPARFVHPTIANYGPQQAGAFRPTIAEWADAIREGQRLGVAGYSLWAHDWQAPDVTTLGAA
jgi:hypothetical protein